MPLQTPMFAHAIPRHITLQRGFWLQQKLLS
jgi:hypothetical protein